MASNSEVNRTQALKLAIGASRYALRDSAHYHLGWFLSAALTYGVQALIPAVQVITISTLVSAMERSDADQIAWSVAVLSLVVGSNFPLAEVAWQLAHRLGLRLELRYQQRLASRAARLTPRELADPLVIKDVEGAQLATASMGPLPGQVLQLGATIVTAIGLCTTIASINLLSGLLVASGLVPTIAVFTFIAQREIAGIPLLAAASRRATYATEQLMQQRSATELATLQSGSKVVDIATKFRTEFFQVLDRITSFGTRMELLSGFATAILLAAALVSMVLQTDDTAGVAATVAGIITGLHAIRASGNAFGQIVSAAPKASLFRSVVGDEGGDLESAGGEVIQDVRDVALVGVSYTYEGSHREALHDISLHARRGEVVALVGANGAGKTTAVNALIGVIAPNEGTVQINGVDVHDWTASSRLAYFGLLSQEYGRYEFTCREVLSLGGPRVFSDTEMWDALYRSGADQIVALLPDGLDTQLGQQWGGVGLSGGQWQRISLARIYLRSAGVWILDEPTSAIDAEAERSIFKRFLDESSQRITIIVSHRVNTLVGVDRIYVFDEGKIVQVGNFDELRDSPGRFSELFYEATSSPVAEVLD